jgi:hypothetical protein
MVCIQLAEETIRGNISRAKEELHQEIECKEDISKAFLIWN